LTSFPGEFLPGIYSEIRFEDDGDSGSNSFLRFIYRKLSGGTMALFWCLKNQNHCILTPALYLRPLTYHEI
jgi:hypothetical protein